MRESLLPGEKPPALLLLTDNGSCPDLIFSVESPGCDAACLVDGGTCFSSASGGFDSLLIFSCSLSVSSDARPVCITSALSPDPSGSNAASLVAGERLFLFFMSLNSVKEVGFLFKLEVDDNPLTKITVLSIFTTGSLRSLFLHSCSWTECQRGSLRPHRRSSRNSLHERCLRI